MNEKNCAINVSFNAIICYSRSNIIYIQSGGSNECQLPICCVNLFTGVVRSCMCFLSLCWLGYHLSFKRHGFLSNRVPLFDTLKQTHVYGFIFWKLVHTIEWKTQGKRLQAFPHMLITTMNFGVVINVVNGQTWDKATHQF